MGSVRDILIRFLGDASGLRSATRDADGAARSFSDRLDLLGKKVGAAEGVGGKLKAGWSGLGDVFGSTAGKTAVAVAGVGALAVAAGKAVTKFEHAAIEVGKFRDATGTTSEEASRFVEVFNDLGIGADAGATAIGRMEKALGQNAHAFDEYGVAVVRAKDGTIDARGTFLNAVDALNRIQDPAKRAAAGADIFGRGWQGMAEIIGSGAPALKSALESVQPSKIFTDADIQAGRDVRDAFDKLADAGSGLLLTLGKALAPVVAELAPILADVVDAAGPLVETLGTALAGAFKVLAPVISAVTTVLKPLIEGLGAIGKAVEDVVGGIDEFFTDMPDGAVAEGAFDGLADKVKALKTAEEQAAASDAYERAIEAKSLALKKEADAALAAARAQEELLSAEMSTIDTSFRLADATDQVAAAAARYNEEGGATAAGARDVGEAMWSQAQAVLANKQALAEAAGQTLDAGQKQQILRDALSESAAKFPQFAEQAREMASALDGIPDGKSVDVSADGAAAAAAGLDEVGAAQSRIASTTSISTEVRNQALTWGLLEAVRLKGVEVDQLAPTVSVSVQGYATAISQLREIAAAAAAAQSAAARAASASVASAQSAQAKINQLRAGAII